MSTPSHHKRMACAPHGMGWGWSAALLKPYSSFQDLLSCYLSEETSAISSQLDGDLELGRELVQLTLVCLMSPWTLCMQESERPATRGQQSQGHLLWPSADGGRSWRKPRPRFQTQWVLLRNPPRLASGYCGRSHWLYQRRSLWRSHARQELRNLLREFQVNTPWVLLQFGILSGI